MDHVRQRHHLVQILGDQQDRRAARARLQQLGMDEGDRPDVQPAHRLVGQDDLRRPAPAPGPGSASACCRPTAAGSACRAPGSARRSVRSGAARNRARRASSASRAGRAARRSVPGSRSRSGSKSAMVPVRWRSSGMRATPARMAARGRPAAGRGAEQTHPSLCGAVQPRSRSEAPPARCPTRPAMPVICPARSDRSARFRPGALPIGGRDAIERASAPHRPVRGPRRRAPRRRPSGRQAVRGRSATATSPATRPWRSTTTR
jgi:hypothetical protein